MPGLEGILTQRVKQQFVKVLFSMVKSEFRFFQVVVESFFGDAVEFGQSALGIGPEGFDAVNMGFPCGKFVSAMIIDAKVPSLDVFPK